MNRLIAMVLVLVVSILTSGQVLAAGLAGFKFLQISAKDHRAVIQPPEGKLRLIREGDVLAEDAKVVEITEGRIVLKRQDVQGQETIVFRVDAGGQRLERYRSSAPAGMPMGAVSTKKLMSDATEQGSNNQ